MRHVKRYLIRWVVTTHVVAFTGSVIICGWNGYQETDPGVMMLEVIMALGCLSVWWLR